MSYKCPTCGWRDCPGCYDEEERTDEEIEELKAQADHKAADDAEAIEEEKKQKWEDDLKERGLW